VGPGIPDRVNPLVQIHSSGTGNFIEGPGNRVLHVAVFSGMNYASMRGEHSIHVRMVEILAENVDG
jgi:hypothetical protein